MFVGRAWLVIGAAATIVGLLSRISQPAQDLFFANTSLWIALICATALVVGIQRLFQPTRVLFKPKGRALEIELKVGDLFDEPSTIVVPVNDFFDTSLGAVVSEASVHGQFLKLEYPNREAEARSTMDALLQSKRCIEQVQRPPAATCRYAVGEAILIRRASKTYLLIALTRTNATSHKTEATLENYVTALERLWSEARDCCNHGDVALPLMGTRTARIGVDKTTLVELTIASAIRADAQQPIAKKITLALRPDDLEEIDLFDIRRRFS